MIRLFVAIDFPKRIKAQFADLVDQLVEEGYPLVFEKEENFHLTLKFLGWCPERRLSEIEEAVKKATGQIRPFWFKPTKIGYFLRESLILWVGVEKSDQLGKLVRRLEDELAKIGFAKEKREFSAHITFGKKRRAQPMKKWRAVAEEIKEKFHQEFAKFKVERIILMQSTLGLAGSIYTPQASFPLKP